MTALLPEGLTRKEFKILDRCSKEVTEIPVADLLDSAEKHLEKVREEHSKNIFVNYRFAREIYKTFQVVAEQWKDIPDQGKFWLKGAIRYFSLSSDLESDFTSPIGFDDDVEIMNACLRLAGRDNLCLDPEDFDDV